MQFREIPLSFDCEGASLLGVLAVPAIAARIGVIIVVGGPQYRVGSHRQFVLLARAMAHGGLPCLRFDYRGMGDSEGAPRNFESIDADIAAAIDALQRETGVVQIVLWGLCDGASAAMMYSSNDARVAGIVAVNPWARTDTGQASVRLRHYYIGRLTSRLFWRKVLAGAADIGAGIRGLASNTRKLFTVSGVSPASDYLRRMQGNWAKCRRPVLIVLSGNDLTAREFEAWIAADERSHLVRREGSEISSVRAADHTFTDSDWREQVEEKTLQWIRGSSCCREDRTPNTPFIVR